MGVPGDQTELTYLVGRYADALSLSDRLILAGWDVDRIPEAPGTEYRYKVVASGGAEVPPNALEGLTVKQL